MVRHVISPRVRRVISPQHAYMSCICSIQVFRRSQAPPDYNQTVNSYFNLLIEYNSTLARRQLPGLFRQLDVVYNGK